MITFYVGGQSYAPLKIPVLFNNSDTIIRVAYTAQYTVSYTDQLLAKTDVL
jgi:hypothetical protein